MIAHIVAHSDEDGVSSSIIIEKYLMSIGYDTVLKTYLKRVFENDFRRIASIDSDLVVFLDVGAAYGRYINKYLNQKKVWVFDHHNRHDEPFPDVELYRNPTEVGKPDYMTSTSYLVYEFLKKNQHEEPKDAVLSLIGMIADMADFVPGRNRTFEKLLCDASKISYGQIVRDWVSGGKIGRPMIKPVLENFVPAPDVEALKLREKKLSSKFWRMNVDRLTLIKEIYPESEKPIRQTLHLKGVEIHDVVRWVRDSKNPVEKEYRMRMIYSDYIPFRPDFIEYVYSGYEPETVPEDAGSFYYYVEHTFESSVIKLNYLSSWYYRDKPVFAINVMGDQAYVHGRLHRTSRTDCNIGLVMYTLAKTFGGDGGGHTYAASARIKETNPHKIISEMKRLCR